MLWPSPSESRRDSPTWGSLSETARHATKASYYAILAEPLLNRSESLTACNWRRELLVTRKVAARPDDKGAVSHIDGFGVRIMIYFDEAAGDTIVAWECLYGVL